MAVSEATIQELKQILKEDYGKEITQAEVSDIASALLGYFDLLAKIYHRENEETDLKTIPETNISYSLRKGY